MPSKNVELEHLKSADVVVDRPTRAGQELPMPKRSLWQLFPRWHRVAKRWFVSEERWMACGFVGFLVAASLGTTWMYVHISYVQRNLETALAEKEQDSFYKAIMSFVVIIIIAAPLFVVTEYVEARLTLEWRRWLTRDLMGMYFANSAYFRLHQTPEAELDNPDQRICEDVPAFVDASTVLCMGLLRKVFNIVGFAGVLWSISPKLVFILLTYCTVGTWLTATAFGKRLMQLDFRLLQKAGDLRFSLLRTRENAESIAFYHGEKRESAQATGRLDGLIVTSRLKLLWRAGLALWSNCYTYATILMPYLLTAPAYFQGDLQFGVITQVGFAFRRIETALNYLVDKLPAISGLAAETERLDVLFTLLQMHSHPPKGDVIQRSPDMDAGMLLQRLTVLTPGHERALCQMLDVQLLEGQSLLIVGPSGCGKSSLLRAISGLWTSGSGRVHTPSDSNCFFLPQKPFMPLGSLRDQLLFPSGDWTTPLGRGRKGLMVGDHELEKLLDAVCLPGLMDRLGGLDVELEFAHVLSQGEQQRVAFLRLLLHQPKLAFLDEATGALDTPTESALYRLLQQQCHTYISIGHRKELIAYHTHVLMFNKSATPEFMTAADYQQRHM
ncbi:hypothetical protein WJX73_004440 [Symbiochloris irregularis]|uniref:ATP-binding cassette transporter n=1 Tax=Symbiochloris irregularis TaxID=706552 RepID=A0AAW1PMC4_9CHLO